jgi:hypothetical protein
MKYTTESHATMWHWNELWKTGFSRFQPKLSLSSAVSSEQGRERDKYWYAESEFLVLNTKWPKTDINANANANGLIFCVKMRSRDSGLRLFTLVCQSPKHWNAEKAAWHLTFDTWHEELDRKLSIIKRNEWKNNISGYGATCDGAVNSLVYDLTQVYEIYEIHGIFAVRMITFCQPPRTQNRVISVYDFYILRISRLETRILLRHLGMDKPWRY